MKLKNNDKCIKIAERERLHQNKDKVEKKGFEKTGMKHCNFRWGGVGEESKTEKRKLERFL